MAKIVFHVLAGQRSASADHREDLATANGKKQARLTEGRTVKAVDAETGPVFAERSPVVSDAPNIPIPPFCGVRVRKDFDLRELFPYTNDPALFKNQAVEDGVAGRLSPPGRAKIPAHQKATGRRNYCQRSI